MAFQECSVIAKSMISWVRLLDSNLGLPFTCYGVNKKILVPHQERESCYKVSVEFSSASQSCPTLCDPMYCSMPGLPVHRQLPVFTQTRLHWVSNAIPPSHPLSTPSPPTFNLSLHQGLFQWVSSLHQVAKVLECQHQSFQWIFRTDFL